MSGATEVTNPLDLDFLRGPTKKLLIGGEWVAPVSDERLDCINPATGKSIASISMAGEVDVDRAVRAAREAFDGPWSSYTPQRRQNMMLALADLVERHFEELHLIDVLDMGMPIGPAPQEYASWYSEIFRYYAGWTTKLNGETIPNSRPAAFSYTVREPVGVVGAIVPWNGPLETAIWKLAPALATGCTIVLKPAEQASLSPLRLAELMQEELDLPAGVVNVVTGDGPTAGAALAAHLDVDKISFTGSTETGRAIVRAATGNLKRVSLELGGKSPNIVLADADLEAAAAGAARGIFDNAGQQCVAGSRIFVDRTVHDEFVERMSDVARAVKVGDPLDPTTEMGPLVSEEQLNRVTAFLESGVEEGATIAVGGERLSDPGFAGGYFVAPTVFSDVGDEMRIAREEIFGPVAAVFAFDDPDEALRRANASDYGLAAAIWTRDIGNAHRFAKSLRAGFVWVNTYLEADPSVPFGGYKHSGWGRELGAQSLDEYLDVKSVWMSTE